MWNETSSSFEMDFSRAMFSATIGWRGPRTGPAPHTFPSLLHPLLVLIISGDVDSIGAGHIEGPLTVDIEQPRAFRCGHHRAEIEFVSHDARERKRHSPGIREPQIGEAVSNRIAPGDRLRVLILEKGGETIERLLSPCDGRLVRAIGSKEILTCIVVRFDPPREHT